MIFSVGITHSKEQSVKFDNHFDAISYSMDRLEEIYGDGTIQIHSVTINETDYNLLSHENSGNEFDCIIKLQEVASEDHQPAAYRS